MNPPRSVASVGRAALRGSGAVGAIRRVVGRLISAPRLGGNGSYRYVGTEREFVTDPGGFRQPCRPATALGVIGSRSGDLHGAESGAEPARAERLREGPG